MAPHLQHLYADFAAYGSAGDALRVERERVAKLETTTAVLQQRITNMASIRERGNQELSSTISRLRAQLDNSRKQQQESQEQVRMQVAPVL